MAKFERIRLFFAFKKNVNFLHVLSGFDLTIFGIAESTEQSAWSTFLKEERFVTFVHF